MADVLDQSEVDALLAAVEGGEVDVQPEEPEKILSGELVVYDFKRPERVSKEQMRSLETLHEVFSRNFQASLSGYLRTIVEVKLVSAEQLTYSEFIMSLPNPTCFNVLGASPLDGQMILEFNPSIIYPILDRLLGGGKVEVTIPDRPLTEIELKLVSTILSRALEQLRATWQNILDIDFRLTETESNPLLIQLVAPNEPVVLICFEVTMGEFHGLINFCIPFKVIEPIMGKFTTQNWFAYSGKAPSKDKKQSIRERISVVPIDVACTLVSSEIRFRDLMALKVGDTLRLGKSAAADAIVYVEGKPVFKARPGKFKRNVAIKLAGRIEGTEALIHPNVPMRK